MPELAYAPSRARRAEQALLDLEFTVSYGTRARLISDDGTTAGTGRQRAADFMEAFEDPAVDVVLAAKAEAKQLEWGLDPADVAAEVAHVLSTSPDVHLIEIALTSARQPP